MKAPLLALTACIALAGCADRGLPTHFRNATAQDVALTYTSKADGQTRNVRVHGGERVLLVSVRRFSDLADLRIATPRRALVVTGRQFAGQLSNCSDRCEIRFDEGDRLNFKIGRAHV